MQAMRAVQAAFFTVAGKLSAVRTSRPTARPAHASAQLIDADIDATLSSLFFLCRSNPTDPLVSRQRSDIAPDAPRGDSGFDRSPKICGQLVHRATCNGLGGHERRLTSKFSGRRRRSAATPGRRLGSRECLARKAANPIKTIAAPTAIKCGLESIGIEEILGDSVRLKTTRLCNEVELSKK